MPIFEYSEHCKQAAQASWTHRWRPAPNVTPPQSIRLFENYWVERMLARAHPVTPALWFGPLIIYGLWLGVSKLGVQLALALAAAGWLVWSLLEYLLHRFVFHRGGYTETQRLRAFLLHGYHHLFPNDGMRLVAPPLMSWPIGACIFAICYFTLGSEVGPVLFAGIAAGYIAYDWIHYATHHFKLSGRLGGWLKRYHLLHHFDGRAEGTRFGVSSPLWDVVFRTYAPVKRRNES